MCGDGAEKSDWRRGGYGERRIGHCEFFEQQRVQRRRVAAGFGLRLDDPGRPELIEDRRRDRFAVVGGARGGPQLRGGQLLHHRLGELLFLG